MPKNMCPLLASLGLSLAISGCTSKKEAARDIPAQAPEPADGSIDTTIRSVETRSKAIVLTDAEKEVVAWVRSIGGEATNSDGLEIQIPDAATISVDDCQRFRNLPHLVSLDFSNGKTNFRIRGSELSDDAILQIAELPRLRTVVVGGSGITDKSLEHLANFPIQHLTVFRGSITSRGLQHFASHELRTLALNNCKQLDALDCDKEFLVKAERINLDGVSITDRFVQGLVAARNLTDLSVRGTRMPPGSLAKIGSCASLGSLDIASLRITDDQLGAFLNLQNLTSFAVSRNQLTERGIQQIVSTFPDLEDFDGSYNRIDPKADIEWQKLHKLKSLSLYGMEMHDEQLLTIAELPKLQTLGINPIKYESTQLSIEAMRTFAQKLPACKIFGATARAHADRMASLAERE